MGAGIVVGNVKHNELYKELECRGAKFVQLRWLLAQRSGLNKDDPLEDLEEVRNFLERISAEVGIPDADVSWVYEISRLRFYALTIS